MLEFSSRLLPGVVVSLLTLSCSSSPKFGEHILDSSLDWSIRFSNYNVSDLSVSRSGDFHVVALSASSKEDHAGVIRVLEKDGSEVWELELETRARHVDISSDGSRTFVSDYRGKLYVYDEEGELVWKKDSNCQPISLNDSDKVLCHYDQKRSGGVALEVFGDGGKSLAKWKSQRWTHVVRSPDGQWIGGLNGKSKIAILDTNLKEIWSQKLSGEVIDLQVSKGSSATIVALWRDFKQSRRSPTLKLSVFKKGQIPIEMSLPSDRHYQRVTTDKLDEGFGVALVGNNPRGQYLSFFHFEEGKLKGSWQRFEAQFADFHSPIAIRDGQVIVGLQKPSTERQIASFDQQGRTRWVLPLLEEEKAFFFDEFVTSGDDGLRVLMAASNSTLKSFLID